MTTRISNTNIGTDDVNSALGSPFPSNKVNIGKKNIIRRLSGDAGRQEETTQISSSNIANKLVLGDLTIVDNSSVTVIDHGSADVPVVSYIIVEASTDIFNPTYQWQFSILDDYASGVLLADISGQQITGFPNRYRIQLSNNNTTTSPNKRALIRATANLFVAQPGQGVTTDPHFVGAKTIDFELRSQVLDAGLVVTESGSKTASSFAPTSVSYQYSASSAAFPGAVYEWSASLVSGIAATIVNNGSTIQFSLTNNNKGTTRSSTYNIEVKMWKDSTKTDLMAISRFANQTFSAEYKEAFLSISVNSTNAKSFAQNSTVNPYADLTASFASESGTTIEWSYSPSFASGTSNVSTGSTTTSNTQRVGFTVPPGTYQLRSETYSVTASQKYSNGFVIASASASFKIAGGNWGHEFSAPPSSVAEGYAAQTAISSVSSIVRAPQATHAWTFTRNTGTAAVISGQTTYTPTLQLTASSAGQDLNNNYTITSRASYDGESSSISRPLSMRAAFLSQTTSMSGNSSATAIVNTGTATASLPISITTTVASPTIEWSATNGVSIAPLTGATTTATLSALNAENIKSFNITATVKDSQGRVVTSITQHRTLTATSFNATFNAPSSVSNTGIGVRTISGVYTGNTVFGGMTMSATRVSGDVLTVSTTAGRVTISGNTDADPATATPAALSSVYRITGTPVSPSGLSGAPFTADVSLSCISSGSAATISASSNTASDYTSTVTSATTASVLGKEPGTSVRWLTPVVVSGVATPVVTNGSTTQSYSLTQTTIGTSSVTLKARAEILDSNAVVVSTIESAAFTLSATRLSTQLNLSFAGTYNSEAINGQASSFADATATSASVPGHSIQIVPTSVDSVVSIGTETGTAYNRTRKFSVVSTGGTVLGGGQIEARLVNTANGAILDTIQANLPTLQAKSYFLTNTLKSATGTANIYEGETNYPSPSYKWTVNGATGSALQSVIASKLPAQTITYSIATTSGGYFTADATSVGLELTGTGIPSHAQVTADFPPISKTNTTVSFSAITGQLTAEDLNTSVEAFANISVTSSALPPGQTLTSTIETLIGGAWVAGAGNSGAVITSTGTNSWRVGLTASSIFRQTTHRLSAFANGVYYYSESFTLTANSYELFLQLDTKKNVDSFNALPNTSSASRTYFWVSSTGIGTGATVALSKTGNASISGATISGARTPTDGAGTTTFSGNVVATIVGGPMNGKTASIPYSFSVVLYEMLNILLNSSSGTTSVNTSGTPNFGSQYKVASTRNYSGTGGRPPYTYIWTQTDSLRMSLLSSTTDPNISVEGIYNKYEIVNGFISLTLRVTDADGRTMTSPVTINGTASYTRTGNISIGNFGSSATVDTSSTNRVEDVLVNPSITGASADAEYTWSLLNNVGGWTIISGQGTSALTIRASANRLETKEASVNVRLTIVDPMAANGSPVGTVSKDFTVIRLFEPFVGNGGSGGGGGGGGFED